MFKFMYLVWALLPIILFYLSASAGIRNAAKKLKEGYARLYLRQAVYSSVALVFAIYIDQYFFEDLFSPIAQFLTANPETGLNIAAWLIYPLLLALFAAIQQAFSKKEETKVIYRSYR